MDNQKLDESGVLQRNSGPKNIFLFSGHMIDAKDRPTSRFPVDKELIAVEAIKKKLDELRATSTDRAICSGACGGDLIFAEACLERLLSVDIYIPFNESKFLETSVNFQKSYDNHWQDRFYAVLKNNKTRLFVIPEKSDCFPEMANPYERCNLWMLDSAMSWGAEKVIFICLWDGGGGDGPGGTRHMLDCVKQRSGQVSILNTKDLWD